MIRRVVLVALVSSGLLLAQSAQQPRLTVHTQVREDIFAGYMADDMDRFEIGVKKLDAMLRENPENVNALSWAGSSELFRAIKAHEAGKQAEFPGPVCGGQEQDGTRAGAGAKGRGSPGCSGSQPHPVWRSPAAA